MARPLTAGEAYLAAQADFREGERRATAAVNKGDLNPFRFRDAVYEHLMAQWQERIERGELPAIEGEIRRAS